MFSNLLENPKLFRHLVEDLPVGIYIVDQERRIRFWNHGAERITGHLSHDVVGHVVEDAMRVCDRRGNSLSGEHCPVAMTLNLRKPQRCTAFSLHKNGHRTAVRIHTRPILEYGDAIGGATVMFEEVFANRDESSGATMYGCLDTNTGIPSRRVTRAVLRECMATLEQSHIGFGLLRIRLLGLKEFRAETRSASGGTILTNGGAYVAPESGGRKFSGMLGRKRISGGADLGQSDDGGHHG